MSSNFVITQGTGIKSLNSIIGGACPDFDIGANLDMNTKDILNVNNIDLTTINGVAYPPVSSIIDIVYPVGSIIHSSISTNPSSYITGTTWVEYGQGRVLVGKATSGTFSTAGAIGGSETKTITAPNLPAHTHPNTLTDPGHAHIWNEGGFGLTVNNEASPAGGIGHYIRGSFPGSANPIVANTTGITITNANNSTTNTALNILQPYVVVYIWTRTL